MSYCTGASCRAALFSGIQEWFYSGLGPYLARPDVNWGNAYPNYFELQSSGDLENPFAQTNPVPHAHCVTCGDTTQELPTPTPHFPFTIVPDYAYVNGRTSDTKRGTALSTFAGWVHRFTNYPSGWVTPPWYREEVFIPWPNQMAGPMYEFWISWVHRMGGVTPTSSTTAPSASNEYFDVHSLSGGAFNPNQAYYSPTTCCASHPGGSVVAAPTNWTGNAYFPNAWWIKCKRSGLYLVQFRACNLDPAVAWTNTEPVTAPDITYSARAGLFFFGEIPAVIGTSAGSTVSIPSASNNTIQRGYLGGNVNFIGPGNPGSTLIMMEAGKHYALQSTTGVPAYVREPSNFHAHPQYDGDTTSAWPPGQTPADAHSQNYEYSRFMIHPLAIGKSFKFS